MSRFKTFDEFLNLFPPKPCQRIKNGYNVLCPAHNDKTPSLSVTQNSNKMLIYCHAGCSEKAILQKLGLNESNLFLNNKVERQIITTYPYKDAEGNILFEVVRYKPKSFKQRRPDGRGGFIWNLEGVKPVLYHLPDILIAVRVGDTIYLTEGEKDADRLWSLGLTATTNPMGASKWKAQYTETLIGAKVILLPHTDAEGRKHALKVIEALEGKAASLSVIDLPETTKDISEWLDQGNNLETLEEYILTPLMYTPKYLSFNTTPEKIKQPETEPEWSLRQWDVVRQLQAEVRGWRQKHAEVLLAMDKLNAKIKLYETGDLI